MVHLSQAIFNKIELIVPLEGPGTKVLELFITGLKGSIDLPLTSCQKLM